MGKAEVIEHWIFTAERDWQSVRLLFEGKQFVHALFFCHLVIEKLLKAHWVRDNDERTPPRIHDLEHLYSEAELQLNVEQIDLLRVMNSWNLEGRYQDYKDKFYKNTTEEYTGKKISEVDKLKAWLLSEMQNER